MNLNSYKEYSRNKEKSIYNSRVLHKQMKKEVTYNGPEDTVTHTSR